MNAPVPSLRQYYDRRLGSMKALRQRHESSWRDIADFIDPDGYEDPSAQTANDGQRRDSAIVNNTPLLALEVAQSGLMKGTCNPSEKWFGLEAADPELNDLHSVRVYCDEVEDRIGNELQRSNFYKCAPEDFRNLLAFGTCATVMEESFSGEAVAFFSPMPMGSYYVAQNQERETNEVARELMMSADQMVEKFGEDKVSMQVKEAVRAGRPQQEFPVVHIVHPNKHHNPLSDALSEDKAWKSCYYEPKGQDGKTDVMLETKGFTVFPIACARWRTVGNNPWGFGCGRNALGDSRALMAMETDSATAVEMEVNPPLVAPPGVEVNLIPGSVTHAVDGQASDQIRPLMAVSHNLQHSTQKINEHEDRIERAFFVNIFLMITHADGEMTATEIMERANEKELALMPILRVGEEYHKPILRFMFHVCGRRGRLPPPPPELEGRELKLKLKSVLFEAAEMQRNTATRAAVANAIQIGQTVPSVLKVPKWDKVIRDDFHRSGAASDLLNSPEEVEAMEQAEQEAIAKQRQGEAANLAANTAKTLADTNTDAKNALTDIMAGLQQ